MGKCYVLCGPSGSGLGEIVRKLMKSREDLASVVPVTARKMKAGETDGAGFWFYDLDGWNAMKESGDLLECTEFAGNDYGTSRRLVVEQLAAGKSVLLNLPAERAAQLKANMPEAVCIWVAPSEEVLRARYSASARHPLEISVRMETAEKERGLSGFCDLRVSSDDLDAAADELNALIR